MANRLLLHGVIGIQISETEQYPDSDDFISYTSRDLLIELDSGRQLGITLFGKNLKDLECHIVDNDILKDLDYCLRMLDLHVVLDFSQTREGILKLRKKYYEIKDGQYINKVRLSS